MRTTQHTVAFSYTRPELDGIFRLAHAEDVEQGGRYDARSAAINVWTHGWQHPATRDKSDIVGTFYCHWQLTALDTIEVDEGWSLEDLLQELGRLEPKAFARVRHGDVPQEGPTALPSASYHHNRRSPP
jgi:hypothetical protein